MTRSLTSAERALQALRELILGGAARARRPARRGRARRAAGRQPHPGPRGADPAGRRGPGRDRPQPRRPGGHLDRRRARGRLRPARRSLEPQLTGSPSRTPSAADVDELDDAGAPDGRRRRPGPTRTSTRWSRSTAPSTTGWSPWPTTPTLATALAGADPPADRARATSTPTTRRRCAAASAHHVEIVAACAPATPTWARAVMTAHIHNARAVMVRGAPARQTRSTAAPDEEAS